MTSADLFEKAILYIPFDIENRILRAKGFRVLCLCHLGLSHLDQAQEYINEAEKVCIIKLLVEVFVHILFINNTFVSAA